MPAGNDCCRAEFFWRAYRRASPCRKWPLISPIVPLDDIVSCEQRWRASRIDPLKTTLVEDKRVMSTWTLRKPA